VSKLNQKSFEGLAQVWLKAHVLLQDLVHKKWLVELKRGKVRKVHLHGGLFSRLDLLSLVYVKPDGLAGIIFAVGVVLVVWIVFVKLEPDFALDLGPLTDEGSSGSLH
jgi:hypothetical protein